ncbi:hypothetical protein Mp_2g25450 [Marchantia polymorpha subsp. ruderalis]|uniref:Uncharacterized protein n=1 Tax=Marchantia polymorpha TaxID=3197 RepID=A0A2R6XBF9_MARPO|nr:hypothetical protein MARPO_0025s0133 [Marchantia polymorpha]BBN03679.1 hypothetical protein Mp_2g25450 [Marchantia polymorpha subsp. ruderalis]|eukprot:PTQ43453.1 hypothetical protein MARPO_0025s0133 [Marchantia polymorpha]
MNPKAVHAMHQSFQCCRSMGGRQGGREGGRKGGSITESDRVRMSTRSRSNPTHALECSRRPTDRSGERAAAAGECQQLRGPHCRINLLQLRLHCSGPGSKSPMAANRRCSQTEEEEEEEEEACRWQRGGWRVCVELVESRWRSFRERRATRARARRFLHRAIARGPGAWTHRESGRRASEDDERERERERCPNRASHGIDPSILQSFNRSLQSARDSLARTHRARDPVPRAPP